MRWNEQQQKLKGTRRTTRMLKLAARGALDGGYVVVLVSDRRMMEMLRQQTARLLDDANHTINAVSEDKIKVRGGGSVVFLIAGALVDFDWQSMRYPGMQPSVILYVDHGVIENRFAAVLEMLHRFDS